MRILHVFDHSIPLQSGYTFRSLSLPTEQRRLGWETHHLTTPRHIEPYAPRETVDGWTFHRTPPAPQTIVPHRGDPPSAAGRLRATRRSTNSLN